MTNYNITSPEPQFSGEVAGVNFSRGKGRLDGDHPDAAAALAYFSRRGYGVNGEATVDAREPFEPADLRDLSTVDAGSLRDGAVEPRSTDAGLPTNAGIDNPHGPRVVSPEVPTPPGQVLETERAAVGETRTGGRPSRQAPKADWQAYGRAQAKDPDEEAAVDGMTKDQLVERYGS